MIFLHSEIKYKSYFILKMNVFLIKFTWTQRYNTSDSSFKYELCCNTVSYKLFNEYNVSVNCRSLYQHLWVKQHCILLFKWSTAAQPIRDLFVYCYTWGSGCSNFPSQDVESIKVSNRKQMTLSISLQYTQYSASYTCLLPNNW